MLMHGDLLFACTSHGLKRDHKNIANKTAPNLIALDKRTGKLVARDRETISERMLHGQWSSPSLGVVGGRPLVFFGGGDGHCYAFEVPDENPDDAAVRSGQPSARAGAADGGVQTLRKVWSRDCNLPRYRVKDGKQIPYSTRFNKSPVGPSEIIGAPVFHDGRVYVTAGQDPLHGPGESELTCLDAATGEVLWQSDLVGRTTCTVAISKGLLYVADYNRRFHCFDVLAGERLWFHELDSGVWTASPLAADGKVYIATEGRIFYVFKQGREKVLLNRQRLPSVAITPAVVNGVFYLPLQRSLVAIRCAQ
jgi:outer membrane protein assembly factor BamB